MFSSLGPERRAVVPRLDDSATATLFGHADTIFGNAICLRQSGGGGRQPPTQSPSGSQELRCFVKVEASNRVLGTTEMLKCLNRVLGGLSRLRVYCQPLGGPVIQYNSYRVARKYSSSSSTESVPF